MFYNDKILNDNFIAINKNFGIHHRAIDKIEKRMRHMGIYARSNRLFMTVFVLLLLKYVVMEEREIKALKSQFSQFEEEISEFGRPCTDDLK